MLAKHEEAAIPAINEEKEIEYKLLLTMNALAKDISWTSIVTEAHSLPHTIISQETLRRPQHARENFKTKQLNSRETKILQHTSATLFTRRKGLSSQSTKYGHYLQQQHSTRSSCSLRDLQFWQK
jgi:hypothetical protein